MEEVAVVAAESAHVRGADVTVFQGDVAVVLDARDLIPVTVQVAVPVNSDQ